MNKQFVGSALSSVISVIKKGMSIKQDQMEPLTTEDIKSMVPTTEFNHYPTGLRWKDDHTAE